MADVKEVHSEDLAEGAADDSSDFIDSTPFWVIWQVRLPEDGRNRIRRISQDYPTLARAEADAEHYRRSGAITWVEEARPLAPKNVPAEALAALRGAGPSNSVTAINA
ncbi:MAG TPA: hypothetical protein VE053_12215 [Allosphingosinicella sp.]|nr:hypothetical protein [Allosphingosinicella sp.]